MKLKRRVLVGLKYVQIISAPHIPGTFFCNIGDMLKVFDLHCNFFIISHFCLSCSCYLLTIDRTYQTKLMNQQSRGHQ